MKTLKCYGSYFGAPTGAFAVVLMLVIAAFAGGFTSTADAEGEALPSGPRWQTLSMRVTAYCPCEQCCGEWADGVTANGHVISQGDRFVAADRRFGFDTQMVIPGYNTSEMVKVYDRGGAIYDNRLDVFFNTHQEALEWGVQYLEVKVYSDVDLSVE
jgi:3D (Asp-Asp-Asp) domain-containing protein